jgi:pentatricopeptide repeat protein
MNFRVNQYVLAALFAASSISYSSALQGPASQTRYRPVAASLLNMPETVHSSGDEDEPLEPEPNQFVRKEKKKPRNNNPAMGDIAFLRKRTAHLLRITAETYSHGPESNDVFSGKMKVDKKTFNWLIDSWAFSGELDASDKAFALLTRMEELDKESSHYSGISPDVRSYTKVINAMARSGRADAGELADKLMKRMETLYVTAQNVAAKPNTFTYTALVEAHANSGVAGSAARAAEICEEMVQKWEDGDADVRPTSRCFNAAINAYAKSGEDDAAQLAESLFDQMVEVYEAGNDDCKPNTFNYNAVICALANSNDEGSALRAQELLERMESQYKAGDDDVKPTTVSFNTVIDAFAKSAEEDAEERAENLLRHMEELFETGVNVEAKPNVRSFNTVINAYAKSGREDAALKAERVLDYMERLYEGGNKDVRPDLHSFCTVINGESTDCYSACMHVPNCFARNCFANSPLWQLGHGAKRRERRSVRRISFVE